MILITGLLGKHLGHEVKARRIDIKQWAAQARAAGLSDYALRTFIKMFEYYEKYDFRGNSQVLGWLLSRRPTSFAQFLMNAKSNDLV